MPPRYAELQAVSNFSFLRGASHPDELVLEAARLGHPAIAVTDRNSLAGIVRAHHAAKEVGLRFLVGCRIDLADGAGFLVFPEDRAAYGRLARLLTLGRRRAPKGECRLDYADLAAHGDGQLLVLLPADRADRASLFAFAERASRAAADFRGRAYLAAQHLYRGDDSRRLARLTEIAGRARLPLVATGEVLYHRPERRPLQDVLTCIREGCTIAEAGFRLMANAERHLKPAAEMARLFRGYEAAVERSLEIVERARFSLDELRYEYPEETIPEGRTAQQQLVELVRQGAQERFGQSPVTSTKSTAVMAGLDPAIHVNEANTCGAGECVDARVEPGHDDTLASSTGEKCEVPPKVRDLLAHELQLIEKLDYARYFLTVHDLVRFARERGILCQGRGSAANSAVCYCLGITAVDPAKIDVLFERFISAARNEPPDIDVDFEHERREEVIQYIYRKYGRERAGIAATVICYRSRSAIREVGKALGLSGDVVAALAGIVWGWSSDPLADEQVREAGLDPEDPNLRRALDLAAELVGFPRHLSQHVGGFVITRGPLCEMVPIENAAMPERTFIEWDKDDLDALGILKIDVLALGMLTCIRKSFELIRRHYGRSLDLASIPAEAPEVYEMLSRADSLGVFQVESRAQMTMLPRLRPREFYDLVIEVAIVRPGPIQGDMVHPYLRRRSGREPVEYPSEELRQVLGKTLGVPLFQEQAMKIAIVGAGFAPEEADRLRRAMATFKKNGDIHLFRDKFVAGMTERGYERQFAERCFGQIEGFGTYGFPESHAASFALLVYVSAWLKCCYPEVFACALMNSQPMGFYAPAQIVRDAREHGVVILPVDVNCSLWDCTLESRDAAGHALRLGFRQIKGFALADADRLVAARSKGYADSDDLWRRSGLGPAALERLAEADAFRSMGLDRRQALWALKGLDSAPLPLFAEKPSPPRRGEREENFDEAALLLPPMSLGEHVVEDYARLGLSLKRHPLAFLREGLAREGRVAAAQLAHLPKESRVGVAGLVLIRQRPGSANGVVFVTIEDETGVANLIVWPPILERFRRAVLGASLLACHGRLQREEGVIHVVAERLEDLSARLNTLREAAPRSPLAKPDLVAPSRDFR